MHTKPSILFRLSMYEVVALDKVACWLLYEIQANCFVVQSLGHPVLKQAEWSQINIAICHPQRTHTHAHTAQRVPLPCVALKVALQWPLWWSMKENLYSGGYWQYFHDISHTKLHSVPCNKSNYFTYMKKGFTLRYHRVTVSMGGGIHKTSTNSVKVVKNMRSLKSGLYVIQNDLRGHKRINCSENTKREMKHECPK